MPPDAAIALRGRDADDDRECRRILRAGSRSFAAAARLLPRRLQRPVAALYAFCRVADDAIDGGGDTRLALAGLHARLDRVFLGTPEDDAIERSLTRVVHEHAIAREVFDALLEGFAADVGRVRVEREDELLDYAVRVASTVGLAMTLVMGARDRHTLACATDLGIAMQLTNIARDVGEDAARDRVYLPGAWFVEVGFDRERWIAQPRFGPSVAALVERVLVLADRHYRRAERGIAGLPQDCRAAIRAAAWIYADIGRVIRARGCDSIGARASTSTMRKLVLLVRARWARSKPLAPLPSDTSPLAASLVEACVAR